MPLSPTRQRLATFGLPVPNSSPHAYAIVLRDGKLPDVAVFSEAPAGREEFLAMAERLDAHGIRYSAHWVIIEDRAGT